MPKVITYNVYRGGEDRLPLIRELLIAEAPDVLAIQEACGWRESGRFEEIGEALGIPAEQRFYFDANERSKSGRVYNMAVYTKIPARIESVEMDPERIWHVSPHLVLQTPMPLHIFPVHFSPKTEDFRLGEARRITEALRKTNEPMVALGDFNSLSPDDPYDSALNDRLSHYEITKFGNPARFEVIAQMQRAGFLDSFRAQPGADGKLHITVTEASEDRDHLDLRLDYIFISKHLQPLLQRVRVIDSEKSRKASDHFPVVAEFSSWP